MVFATQYECNDHFFDVIDSPIKAYWFGFIVADGHIDRRLVVVLKPDDRGHLELLRQDLGFTGPIYTRKKDGTADLSIGRSALVKGLRGLGLTSKKTIDLEWEHLPDYLRSDKILIQHFLRGFFDGDGCLCTTSKKTTEYIVAFTCYKLAFLERISDHLSSTLGILHPSIYRGKTAYYLKYYDRTALKLCSYLYQGADRYLVRKYDKYLEMVNYYTNNPAASQKGKLGPITNQIISYYSQVKNVAMVAGRFNCQPSNIKALLNKSGISTERDYSKTRRGIPSGRWQHRKDEVIALYRELKNAREVASRLGAHYNTIRHILLNSGISLR